MQYKPKTPKYKPIVEPKEPRWVVKKFLGSLSYLHQLRRDDKSTLKLRKELVEEVKEAKKPWKEFIREYRVLGYFKAIENRKRKNRK